MTSRTTELGGIMTAGTDDRIVTRDNPLIINQPLPSYGTVEIQPGGDILTQVETVVTINKLKHNPDPRDRGQED